MNKKLYHRYYKIKERCYNPKSKSYHRYGGRGIKMCDEWFNSYDSFEKWCFANGYRDDLAIDRIDNDGDYEPDNCRFVTLKENNQNRCSSLFYTINGITKNLQQWCDEYGMKRGTVYDRIFKRGMSIEEALTKPIKNRERDRTSLIGKRFGRLLVVGYAGDEFIGKDNNSRWLCECDCGNTAIVGANKLKSGHTRSCGCMVSDCAKARMLSDKNPMKSDKQRQRMKEYNPSKKKG